MLYWVRENQPLINFGLLIGAIVYTIVTGFILRVSARQLRTMVQPALTLKGPFMDSHHPALQMGSLGFQNNGSGPALNIIVKVAVRQGSVLNRSPKFDVETRCLPSAVEAGAEFVLPTLHTAVESSQGATGNLMYKLLHEYEVFISYASIAGAKYLTHLSVGLAGDIDSFYVGEMSVARRVRIRAGILWRYYRQRNEIRRRLRQRGKQDSRPTV